MLIERKLYQVDRLYIAITNKGWDYLTFQHGEDYVKRVKVNIRMVDEGFLLPCTPYELNNAFGNSNEGYYILFGEKDGKTQY